MNYWNTQYFGVNQCPKRIQGDQFCDPWFHGCPQNWDRPSSKQQQHKSYTLTESGVPGKSKKSNNASHPSGWLWDVLGDPLEARIKWPHWLSQVCVFKTGIVKYYNIILSLKICTYFSSMCFSRYIETPCYSLKGYQIIFLKPSKLQIVQEVQLN